MIAVTLRAGFHPARIRSMSVFRQSETTHALARHQSGQPARVLLRRTEGMDCMDRERTLHGRQ